MWCSGAAEEASPRCGQRDCRRSTRSAYDAAYLALAEKLGEPLITGDGHLYNAVQTGLDWVWWVEAYEERMEHGF